MKLLNLGKHRQARVWLGELPNATYPSVKTLTHTIAAGRESKTGLRLAAIEVYVPLGPRSMYGLLGGQLEPTAVGHLSIDVSIAGANERLLSDSLAMKGDEVRVGLPAQYFRAVLAGVDLARAS